MPIVSANLDRDPVDVAIGSRLRVQRTRARLSLEKLGGQLGITYQQVQKYESGANRLSCAMLLKVCTVLQCEPTDILGSPSVTSSTVDRDVQTLVGKLSAIPAGQTRTIVMASITGMLNEVAKRL